MVEPHIWEENPLSMTFRSRAPYIAEGFELKIESGCPSINALFLAVPSSS
jgi:hypothetical protein